MGTLPKCFDKVGLVQNTGKAMSAACPMAQWALPMLNKCELLTLQVVLCLYSLGRVTQKHPEYTGPAIGPKMAEKNARNFTEEQIR